MPCAAATPSAVANARSRRRISAGRASARNGLAAGGISAKFVALRVGLAPARILLQETLVNFSMCTMMMGTFDPMLRTLSVLLDIDPRTGVLVTSYANIVDIVQGPRMALIIDPGDDVYPERFGVMGNTPRAAGAGR